MSILDTLKRVITGPQPQLVPDLGRNDRCWCGSGRKYKACHMATDDRKRSAARTGAVARPAGRGF